MFEDIDPAADAEDADPLEMVDFALEIGPGVFGEGGADDASAGSASAACDQEGEDSFAGDQAQWFHPCAIVTKCCGFMEM